MIRRTFTPRRLAAAVAVALALPLAACGSSSDDASSDQAWTYTDDLGTKLELDKAPERIVAQSSVAAALTDLGLGDKIVGVFGPVKNADGDVDSQAAGLDVDSVEDVTGEGEYGDIDLEKMAGLKPDLIVTSSYVEPDLWYINKDAQTKLDKQYQTLVISFDGKTLPQIIESTEKAAKALGASDDAGEKGQEAFDAAKQRLTDVAEGAKPSILAVSYSPDLFYVSNPDVSPDLKYYRDEIGLDIVTPKNPDEGGYFESLSWEKADTYDADIAYWDDRIGSAGLAALKKEPVWGKTTAAKNDAYIPWTSVAPPSAQAYADVFDRFADGLEKYTR
ncbi:ABC transporter substrate-binding protein [Aeromicrobium sp.]|uniref:ABC transporter substrate-binding protein n=1 Tax=Aeromicrobium sp. TaxID=1871063 RepID=UPI003513D074